MANILSDVFKVSRKNQIKHLRSFFEKFLEKMPLHQSWE